MMARRFGVFRNILTLCLKKTSYIIGIYGFVFVSFSSRDIFIKFMYVRKVEYNDVFKRANAAFLASTSHCKTVLRKGYFDCTLLISEPVSLAYVKIKNFIFIHFHFHCDCVPRLP